MNKKYLLCNLKEGYFQGTDYDNFKPIFSTDSNCARVFESEQEAENQLSGMSKELREVRGVYSILPVILID